MGAEREGLMLQIPKKNAALSEKDASPNPNSKNGFTGAQPWTRKNSPDVRSGQKKWILYSKSRRKRYSVEKKKSLPKMDPQGLNARGGGETESMGRK